MNISYEETMSWANSMLNNYRQSHRSRRRQVPFLNSCHFPCRNFHTSIFFFNLNETFMNVFTLDSSLSLMSEKWSEMRIFRQDRWRNRTQTFFGGCTHVDIILTWCPWHTDTHVSLWDRRSSKTTLGRKKKRKEIVSVWNLPGIL